MSFCLPSQVGCKALVFPSQFKTQKYYDILKQSCPELEKSSPGGIKSKRWVRNIWCLCTDLTALCPFSCTTQVLLKKDSQEVSSEENKLGWPRGLPWPVCACLGTFLLVLLLLMVFFCLPGYLTYPLSSCVTRSCLAPSTWMKWCRLGTAATWSSSGPCSRRCPAMSPSTSSSLR